MVTSGIKRGQTKYWETFFRLRPEDSQDKKLSYGRLYLKFHLTSQEDIATKKDNLMVPPASIDFIEHKFKKIELPPNPWIRDSPNWKPPNRHFRILSLDGGGVRGIFTLVLLER